MTETRKESLSALIDGEASEIEVHRLVREFRSDESLSDSWAIYQHVRTTIRSSDEQNQFSPDHHRQLFGRISEAVHSEDSHQHQAPQESSPAKVVVGSLALAASLVVAIFVGVQKPEDAASLADATVQPQTFQQPVAVQTVATTESQPQAPYQPQASELVELDEEKQRRLRAYLNQHDRMARMNTNSQLVNYKKAPGK